MTTPDIEPCPWCQCSDIFLLPCENIGGSQEYCWRCRMRGPVEPTPAEAIDAWNTLARLVRAGRKVEAMKSALRGAISTLDRPLSGGYIRAPEPGATAKAEPRRREVTMDDSIKIAVPFNPPPTEFREIELRVGDAWYQVDVTGEWPVWKWATEHRVIRRGSRGELAVRSTCVGWREGLRDKEAFEWEVERSFQMLETTMDKDPRSKDEGGYGRGLFEGVMGRIFACVDAIRADYPPELNADAEE